MLFNRNTFKHKYSLIVLFLAFALILESCQKNNQQSLSQDESMNSQQKGLSITPEDYTPHRIAQLGVYEYVLITISFYAYKPETVEQGWKEDQEEMSISPEDNAADLAFKQQFFQDWGISEDEFSSFGETHVQEIETFLIQNPELDNLLKELEQKHMQHLDEEFQKENPESMENTETENKKNLASSPLSAKKQKEYEAILRKIPNV